MQHKCSVKRPSECSTGNHHFIVSRWVFTQSQQSANGYTCTRCLLTVDGKFDIDRLKHEIDSQQHETFAEPNIESPRGKGGKSPNREKQNSEGQS